MKKNKKKVLPVILIIIMLLAVAATAIFFFINKNKNKDADNGKKVFVSNVGEMCNTGFNTTDKYMGKVESQEVKYVDAASERTIKEIFVEEGDEVKVGDKLFEYNTDEMNLKLRQLELELTSIYNSISTYNKQISELAKEREDAPDEEKIDYTTQIQSIQVSINQLSYDASNKQLEIDRQKNAMENAVVYSPIEGIIKKVNKQLKQSSGYNDNGYNGDGYGQNSDDNHFITIMNLGDYRIKCTADEMNIRSINVGSPMIVTSRVDSSLTWRGCVSLVDTENPLSNNDNYSGGGESTTKYPFYITLDSSDNLILGQHIVAEFDYGQGTMKSGIWLYEGYLMFEDGKAYVWAEDKNKKIEKRKVELGKYDENLMKYEIVSGLSESDNIAFPDDRIKEGMKTTTMYESSVQAENLDNEGVIDDEGVIDNNNEQVIDSDTEDGNGNNGGEDLGEPVGCIMSGKEVAA